MPAWTAPRDWTVGELVTEGMLDTHLRDNSLSMHNMTIIRRTAGIAGSAAWVEIPWEFPEDLDELGMWTLINASRFTAPYAGRFEANIIGTWTGQSGTGINALRILRFTSASVLVETWGANDTTFGNQSLSVPGSGRMDSGDYLEVEQYSGWTGTVGSGTFRAVLFGRG